jgi:hypothetical protein
MTCLPSTRSRTNKIPRRLTPADLIRQNKLSGGGFQPFRARPRANPGNSLRLGNQRHDMRGPFLQRLLALGVVIGAVIGASDTRLVAGSTIDRGLDDVRLHRAVHRYRHAKAATFSNTSWWIGRADRRDQAAAGKGSE